MNAWDETGVTTDKRRFPKISPTQEPQIHIFEPNPSNVEQLQKVGLASLLIPNAINFQGAFDSLQDRQSPGAAGKDGV